MDLPSLWELKNEELMKDLERKVPECCGCEYLKVESHFQQGYEYLRPYCQFHNDFINEIIKCDYRII